MLKNLSLRTYFQKNSMKKIAALVTIALCFSIYSFAQDNANTINNDGIVPEKKKIFKPSRDFVMLQFTYDTWDKVPDSVKLGGIGRGFNAYLCYDFPIAKSNFSFAAGLGVSNSNIYFKEQHVIMNTTAPQISFQNIDSSEASDFKRSKLAVTYIEAPFELRFYGNKDNRNRGFKFALGMKVGLLVNAHTKERESSAGPYINTKISTRRYVQNWRFAPTARIGWGNFTLFGSYNITQLFNAGQGPEVYPLSVGLCISGL